MEYKMTIAGLERSLPLCKVSDDLYIGAFVIFGDPELTTACAEELLKRGNIFWPERKRNSICEMFSKSAWIPSRQRALRNFILTAAMPSL